MTLHINMIGQGSLGQGDLHDPLGSSRVGALSLQGNNQSAWSFLDPNTTNPIEVFGISTVNGASTIRMGAAGGGAPFLSLPTILSWGGGELDFAGSAGTSGQFLMSLGPGVSPQWATPGSTSGTTFVINANATPTLSQGTLQILSGDGAGVPNNDVERYTIQTHVDDDSLLIYHERNRNNAGYAQTGAVVALGQTNTTNLTHAILFQGGDGTHVQTGQIAFQSTLTNVYNLAVTISGPGTTPLRTFLIVGIDISNPDPVGSNSERYGAGATTNGTNSSTAIGNSASAGFASSLAIGRGSTATAANQCVIGSGPAPYNVIILGSGDINSAPSTTTILRTTDGTGTNVAGSSLLLRAGNSTGNAIGGDFEIDLCASGSSGTTLNSAFERMLINPDNGWWRNNSTSALGTAGWQKTGSATTTDGTTTQTILSIPIGAFTPTGGGFLEVWVDSVRQTTLNTAVFHNWVRFSASAGAVTVVTSTQDVANADAAINTIAVTVVASSGNINVNVVGVAAMTIIHNAWARWQAHS